MKLSERFPEFEEFINKDGIHESIDICKVVYDMMQKINNVETVLNELIDKLRSNNTIT